MIFLLFDYKAKRVYLQIMELSEKTKIFSALSDQLRLRLVSILGSREQACGKELAETLEISVALASHHARILEDAGLIVRKKEGQYSRFSLNRETLRRLLAEEPLKLSACE